MVPSLLCWRENGTPEDFKSLNGKRVESLAATQELLSQQEIHLSLWNRLKHRGGSSKIDQVEHLSGETETVWETDIRNGDQKDIQDGKKTGNDWELSKISSTGTTGDQNTVWTGKEDPSKKAWSSNSNRKDIMEGGRLG